MSSMREGHFTITDEHITLLKNMNITFGGWEYQAPMVDGKRPYGNSDVPDDIYRLLGWTVKCCDECGVDWGDEDARRIHEEMEDVLQIAVAHPGEDIKGNWFRKYSYHNWLRAV